MNIKDLAYQGKSPLFQVTLAGVDISDYVGGVSDISTSLDYPRLTEYREGEGTLSLNDPDGYFSPRNDANFFVENGQPQSGDGVECTITAGFYDNGTAHSETLFVGKVIKATQNARSGITRLLVSDAMNSLFRDKVEDIGIARHFRLVEGESNDVHGFYPIPAFVGPAAKGSVTVNRALNSPLTEKDALSNIGNFNSNNYLLTEEGIKTEGGPVATSGGYPQIEMKSPYRHRTPAEVITAIATAVGIADVDIGVPYVELATHFYSEGRLGYDIINASGYSGSGSDAGWKGYITDMLWDTDRYYGVLNSPRQASGVNSTLFYYEKATKSYSILYQSSSDEFWKVALLGNTIALLATESAVDSGTAANNIFPDYRALYPRDGSYDARETGNTGRIIYYNIQTGTDSVAVASDNQYRPQLAVFLALGGTYYETLPTTASTASYQIVTEVLPDMLPDTRRSFLWHNNELYYAYVDGNDTDKFGVAKCNLGGDTTSSVVELTTDGTNHAGLAFWITGNELRVAYTRRKGAASVIEIYTQTL